jgi:predicted enzyme related to lactoylglutathione lyase
MPRVIHFEIQAEKPDRAIAFYRDIFGWKFERYPHAEYWLIRTGDATQPGIDGGLLPRRGAKPEASAAVNAFVCTLDVDAIDRYVARVVASGGAQVVEKMAVPDVGWLAYCKDCEGNIFGLMQSDPGAH